ncbi:MAG: flagellar basal-body MS-ring/collar protein FliF [Gammaproteobacteria bacterium]|nr:flagellar basal-body MS-ring/collar protein FliF [Gammaproteobacteria bacterium]
MADKEVVTTEPTALPLYAQLPPAVRQVGWLVAIAGAVAIGVALVLWTQGGRMVPLFPGMTDRDASQVVAAIEAAGIDYEIDSATGNVLVPADRKHELMMELATDGAVPGGGYSIESISEMTGLGQTPTMEQEMILRVRQTELKRSIETISAVAAAEVLLGVPAVSPFVRSSRQPTASVVVTLYPGRRLEPAQIDGIANLVAGAVPELSVANVSILDQQGTPLTTNDDGATPGFSNRQQQLAKEREDAMAAKIVSLLAPFVGADRVRATVTADFDFTVAEETLETYNPDVSLVVSEETSEQVQGGDGLAQGVPGALTNQPPDAAPADAAAVQAAAAAGEATASVTSRTAIRNFERDRTMRRSVLPSGTIQRLSVGVLLDYRPADGGDPVPLSEEEIQMATNLAMQAVGYDAARGDTIEVHNLPFLPTPAVAAPEPPALWQQPWVWTIGRQALGAILVIVLAFFIVRPIMRTLTKPQPLAPALPPGAGGLSALPAGQMLPVGYDDRMAAVRNVAGQDPRQVAQVVRNWVAQDND